MSKSKVEEHLNQKSDESSNNPNKLQFTGNWFIDAGILGFVNLMEEVYGWDLKELQKESEKRAKAVYYWYFPIGYICHVVRERQTKEGLEKREQIDSIISEIPEAPQTMNEKDIFERAWEWIINNEPLIEEKEVKRIKMSWAGRYRILTNFPLFQPRYDLKRQKDIFMSLLGLKEIEDEILRYIDKATSKFLPSASDFPNISFTKSCITMEDLFSLNSKAPIFILTYPLAFISETLDSFGYQIMFYSNELAFTYNVGKKLKLYLKKASERDHKVDIFRLTWNSIIDSVIELESLWSLESMYLIKIKPPKGLRQDLDEVEYIGIPKLQASILVEDPIREALNNSVLINKDLRVWVLEEFIKNKSLYDVVLKHVSYCLREKNERNIQRKMSLYALAIDAKIKENNEIELFSNRFLEGFRSLVNEIKDCYSIINLYAINISRLFDNEEERRQIYYSLISALKKKNRIAFVNILLKKFLEKAGNKEVSRLNRFVFENIIPNDISWENYALALVIGILSFGGGYVEEEPED